MVVFFYGSPKSLVVYCRWEFTDGGKQIKQKRYSIATLALGDEVFDRVRFTGTLFVEDTSDDDMVGFLFNYQDNKNFYLVTATRQNSRQV